ncbi:MAG: FAD-dependent oxidoreductase [Acidimicrobiaceae bacterium]|nr:FAD-dependent oxidoreductase [Acidimicrobiaceae bacterium]
MPQPRDSVTVVGASLAGLWAAETLRREGFEGRISLVGDEPHAPYDRPPLSKKYLAGAVGRDRVDLLGPDKVAELDVDLRLGCRATGLDVAGHVLEVDGVPEPFDGLVVATGTRCRTLPGTDGVAGVHVLRTVDDADSIAAALPVATEGGDPASTDPCRVVVVGAGFIGAEVASTAVDAGAEVAMVEALDEPFGRVLGVEMGAVLAELHRFHGVDLRTGVGVAEVLADGPEGERRVIGICLTDGSELEADLVVVGIGVVPNVEWLDGSGLVIDDGVVCDETCLAAPDVVAAGDAARWTNPRYGESMRVEHWDNAVQQGAHVARRLLATDEEAEPFAPVPWFWSDQYDRKLQLAGWIRPDDEVRVVNGSTDEHRFVAFYGTGDRFSAVLGMNRPRHLMQAKMLLDDGASWDDALNLAADWD